MAKKYKVATQQIVKTMEKHGVTQYRLSKILGIRTDMVNRMVHSKNPTLKTLNKLAKAIDCRVSELIGE